MLLGQPAVRTSAFQVPVAMVAIFLPLQSSAAVPAMHLRSGRVAFTADTKKPRNARLFIWWAQ